MSLKFLNLKGFHPANQANQKRIWQAEQNAKELAQREKDAANEVRARAEQQHFQLLAVAKGDVDAARRLEAQQVSFMYAPPPGLEKVKKAEKAAAAAAEDAAEDVTEDDAVRAFRRKMERTTKREQPLDGPRNLERYVGRRPDERLTIKNQVERFPFLKHAPVEGERTDAAKVHFQPVGMRLRNVKCMRCSEWGHQSGDRECALRDANPHDAARQLREDPMAQLAQTKHELVLRKASLPLEMQEDEAFEILLSEDDDVADAESRFIAQLSAKEKRRLLKTLKQQQEEHPRRRTRDKHLDSRSSESDSDSSNNRSDRRHAKRRKRHESHKATKKMKKRAEASRQDASDSDDNGDRRRRVTSHRRDLQQTSRKRHDDVLHGSHGRGSRKRPHSRRHRSRSQSRERRERSRSRSRSRN